MPLVETESLIIKSYNLAEADKIVVLLTREHGVVRGVAKGAKRLKSRFGSGLEPFSLVRVEYFEKDSVELVSIQRVDLLQSNFTAASNPDFLQKFSYLADILIAFSPPHDPNETLYRMARACIDTAANDAASLLSTGVYFELWLLRLAGYLPDWSRCDTCGCGFDAQDGAKLTGDLCLNCFRCAASSGQNIDASIRLLSLSARRLSPGDFADFARGREVELANLSAILKRLISQSTGREVAGETSLALNV